MEQSEDLGWAHKIGDIRERRSFKREADAAECALITKIFGDAECQSLAASYTIKPLSPGRYRVSGQVDARLGLVCGVTLDPMEQHVSEAFDLEFRVDGRRETVLELEIDALGDDEPELIAHGEIQIGRFLCEIVASAIDPFPRSDQATLDQTEAQADAAAAHPFAILSQLKDGSTSD